MSFKYTTDVFEIRSTVTETAANTYTQQQINVSLDSLNREVLVIMSVDLDCGNPDLIAGTSTAMEAVLFKKSATNTAGINDPNTIANLRKDVKSLAAPDAQAITFVDDLPSLQADLPFLSIVATDDMFLAVKGTNNANARNANVLVRARRAKADADTYAALVTSEAGLI